jgi:hypothetical protein
MTKKKLNIKKQVLRKLNREVKIQAGRRPETSITCPLGCVLPPTA